METNQMKTFSKTQYKRQDIAWPTIGLFSLSVGLTVLTCALGTGWILPLQAFDYSWNASYVYWILSTILGIICFLVCTVCSYAQFTVAHDAVHVAISKKYRKLNDWIGWAAQLWLGPTSSWHGLRYNHLKHHAHTNNAVMDPDYWCSLKGPGGKYLAPLRWLCVDVSYFHMYYIENLPKKPLWIQFKAYMYEFTKIGLLIGAYYWGWLPFLLQYWILPSRLALFILAYAFDFLPHFPHDITRKENRYKTTAYLYTPWILRPLLTLLTFYQNYHIAHHLVPIVPFYRYKHVWEDMKEDLLEEGIVIRDILPKLIEEKIVDVLGDDEYHELQKCK